MDDMEAGASLSDTLPRERLRQLRQAALDSLQREGATFVDIAVSEKIIADIDRELEKRRNAALLD